MKQLKKISSTSALLCLIAAFTFTASQAQSKSQKLNPKDNTLLGKVINAQSGRALASAKVTIRRGQKHSNNKGTRWDTTVTTNTDGTFSLKNLKKGNYAITVQRKGYQQWKNTIYMPKLSKKHSNGPFNGFFQPNPNDNGWLHGVFHTNNYNNKSANLYAKSMFVIIGLQKK
jgi:hypothetical protein